MAKKTKEEAEKTKQSIFDAALKVFERKGFVSTTLNDIAKEAGVTRGAIYWHFKNKTDLFLALNEEIELAAICQLEDIRDNPPGNLADLKRCMLNYLALYENDERLRIMYEIILYKTEMTDELAPLMLKERQRDKEIAESLETSIKRLQDTGELTTKLSSVHIIIMIKSFVIGLIDMWIFKKHSFSIKDDTPAMIELFFESLSSDTNQ